uniref:Uncharacterized protein n=1 Tax=Myoviridae sp. ctwSu1 TaxID=2825207 RepID=A0A8S5U178_9CAUD|nr:MAG TPA: hypothetical protein [Myoviridae sp. ctwSu1]
MWSVPVFFGCLNPTAKPPFFGKIGPLLPCQNRL